MSILHDPDGPPSTDVSAEAARARQEMSEMTGTAIPCLPIGVMEETLAFWTALGFEITYQQRAPNAYASIQNGTCELHFYALPALKPAENFSSCIVMVTEVENLHQEFSLRMRNLLGRAPAKGFPRISRMRPGQTRFTVTDTAGNSIYFIKTGKEDQLVSEAYKEPDQTEWQRTLNLITRLRDYHLDDSKAAKVLDVALARHDPDGSSEYGYALAARIDLAVALGEQELVPALLDRLEKRPLDAGEREALRREFAVLADLGFAEVH